MIAATFLDWDPQHDVWDLQVLLDKDPTMEAHINSVCRYSTYRLCQTRVAQKNLSHDIALTLVHSFIVTHLDSSNAVLAGNVPSNFLKSVCAQNFLYYMSRFQLHR